MTQTSFGGAVSLPSVITAGQSSSAISAVASGPNLAAMGSMVAGGIGASLSYQMNANFIFNAIGGGSFSIDPVTTFALGSGFDSAMFQILLNGNLFQSQSFKSLASAEAFFSPGNPIDIQLAAGFNNIQLAFNETLGAGEGFGFSYDASGISAAPLPPSWTMMLMGLFLFGFFAHRWQKKNGVIAAA